MVVDLPVEQSDDFGVNIGPTRDSDFSTSPSTLYDDFSLSQAFATYTPSQKRFSQEFFSGQNLLLTGEAGTGKSYLMRTLFDFVHDRGLSLAKTASTGVAAFNIGGQTIHSWAGLGLADEDVQSIIVKCHKNKKAQARMRAAKVLVIDEISMVKAELLDKLDLVMKYFRGSSRAFGGVQLVIVGDFMQLPPVWRKDEVKDFAFNSRSWHEANVKAIELKEKVRQDGDGQFAQLLSRIRRGDASDLSLLTSRIDARFPSDEIEAVRIFCKNVDVNQFNQNRLNQLPGQIKSYRSKDSGQDYHIEYFNKNCPAPQNLELKIGAQVMLLANLNTERGFVNGSIGVVKAFGPDGITVKFKNGTILVAENEWEIKEQVVGLNGQIRYKVVATRIQFPLKLCWGVTVHKVQGATLDRAIIDMNEAFATGQVYVSLSRVRNLESLSIVDFPASAIRVNQECLSFYDSFSS